MSPRRAHGAMAVLVRRDLRRRPGQTITLAILTLLAATLLNTALALMTDYSGNIDRLTQEWNTPSLTAVAPAGPQAQAVVAELENDQRVSVVETIPAVAAQATVPTGDDEFSTLLTIIDLDAPFTMGTVARGDHLADAPPDGIWLPDVFQASGDYALGDPITITTSAGERTFHIQGFLSGLYGQGSTPGLGRLTFGLERTAFEAFADPGFEPVTIIQVRSITPTAGAQAAEEATTRVRSEADGGAFKLMAVMDLDLARQATMTSTNIVVAVLVSLAGIVVLVGAIVTHFVVRGTVDSDLPSIGMLRAAGHTGTGILASLIAAQVVTVALAAGAGVAASYPLLGALARTFRVQSGLPWQPSFSLVNCLLTVAVLVSFVVVVTAVAARQLRRLSTVEALRQGAPTHSFTRTRLPLATTAGPLPLLLGVKGTQRHLRHHIMAATTVAVIAFAAVSGHGMVHGLFGDRHRAVEILAGYTTDIAVQLSPEAAGDDVLDTVRATDGVEQAYYFTIVRRTIDDMVIGFTVTPDLDAVPADPMVSGRMPRHANEIALSWRVAERLGVDRGDTIELDLGNGPASFIVTGLTSTGRFLGLNAYLRTDGYQRLDPGFTHTTIAADVGPGVDRAGVVDDLSARLGARAGAVTDHRSSVEAEMGAYMSTVPVISAALTVLIVVMTLLVIGLVVGASLRRTRRDMGVCRALGYTTGQLVNQMQWEHLPMIAAGAALGALIGALTLNRLLGLVVGALGVVLVDLPLDLRGAGLIALGIIALASAATALSYLGIRRVGTAELIKE